MKYCITDHRANFTRQNRPAVMPADTANGTTRECVVMQSFFSGLGLKKHGKLPVDYLDPIYSAAPNAMGKPSSSRTRIPT